MNKKKSVSIILTIILTILIGITGCGTKNIQNSSGSSDRLASSDNLIVSDTSDLTDTTNNDSHTSSETQSKKQPIVSIPSNDFPSGNNMGNNRSNIPNNRDSEQITASYSFSGKNAAMAGYAEGTVSILSKTDNTNKEYYLYFADDKKALPNYEEIARLSMTGKQATYSIGEGVAIPSGATQLLIFDDVQAPNDLSTEKAVASCRIPKNKQWNETECETTFASVSDIHLNYNHLGAAEKWTDALQFFKSQNVKYVIVSGDVTNSGEDSLYESYINAIAASGFSKDMIYESRGNHESMSNDTFIKYTSGADEIRPFKNSPYFYILKKGKPGQKDNLFIFMAQELTGIANSSNCDNFSTSQLDWVEKLLKTYSGTNTNIFIVQHSMIRNFGPGDRYNGAYSQPIIISEKYPGNMRFVSLLREYKEVIWMSGHTHLSLYDGCNYSTEKGTAARMIHNSSISQPRGYTSAGSISYDNNGETTDTEGSEGYIVKVYNDRIIYTGYNLTTKQIIPAASFVMSSYIEKHSNT